MALRIIIPPLLLAAVLTSSAAADSSAKSKSIYAAKAASVRISHLSDVAFAPGASLPPPQQIAICIFSNSGGRYHLTAQSSNAAGAELRLRSGAAFIAYRATWQAGTDGSPLELASGLPTAQLGGGDPVSETCGGGTNALLEIALDGTSFASAPAGTYLDILSLSVAPD